MTVANVRSFLGILCLTIFFSSVVAWNIFAGGLHGVRREDTNNMAGKNAQARRQNQMNMDNSAKIAMFQERVKTRNDSKHGRPETYLEPYWDKGHWVFFRLTSTIKPDSGEFTRPRIHVHCDLVCLDVYKNYGMVCGRFLDDRDADFAWDYVYQTFKDVCELELTNCNVIDRTFHLMYKGPCRQYADQPSLVESRYHWSGLGDRPLIMPTYGDSVVEKTHEILAPLGIRLNVSSKLYDMQWPENSVDFDVD